jgi:hypothetical protein
MAPPKKIHKNESEKTFKHSSLTISLSVDLTKETPVGKIMAKLSEEARKYIIIEALAHYFVCSGEFVREKNSATKKTNPKIVVDTQTNGEEPVRTKRKYTKRNTTVKTELPKTETVEENVVSPGIHVANKENPPISENSESINNDPRLKKLVTSDW